MRLLYEFKHKVPSTGEVIQLAIRKPTRFELDEIDMVYSQYFSEAVSRGILTKDMLTKTYNEFGGVMTKKEAEEYSKVFEKFVLMGDKIANARNESTKKKYINERLKLYSVLQDLEMQNQEIYAKTADHIARNKSTIFFTLLLAMVKKGDEYVPVYKGKDGAERYADFADKEEVNSLNANTLLEHFAYLTSYWYYSNNTVNQDDFEAYESMSHLKVYEELQPSSE